MIHLARVFEEMKRLKVGDTRLTNFSKMTMTMTRTMTITMTKYADIGIYVPVCVKNINPKLKIGLFKTRCKFFHSFHS